MKSVCSSHLKQWLSPTHFNMESVWSVTPSLTEKVVMDYILIYMIATDATWSVSYTTYEGGTAYGPIGLGQYLISSYLSPPTHTVWSSRLFTDRALSPTDIQGPAGIFAVPMRSEVKFSPLNGKFSCGLPITTMCTLACHNVLFPPPGTPINLDLKCAWEQKIESEAALADDVMTEVQRRGAHGNV